MAPAFAALGSAMAEVTAGFTLEQQQVIARWAEVTTAVLRDQAAALRRSA